MACSGFEAALRQAIGTHDRSGAVELATRALGDGSVAVPGLYAMLSEILVEMGEAWQTGSAEVWQEHLATGIVRTIVEACAPWVGDFSPDAPLATVLVAAPDDEYHDLGLRMLADRFTLAGWRAHFLGAALPVEEAIAAVEELQADAISLSASTHFHRLALRPYVSSLRVAHPELRVWVGGAAFAREQDGWPEEMVLDPANIPSPGEV